MLMTLISGKSFNTREQAVEFLLRDRHLLLKPEVVEWFNYARIYFSESELKEKSEELIGKQVRKSFPRNAECLKETEYVITPYYQFVTSSYPCYYDFTLDLYLVASIEVEHWTKGYREYSVSCVVIELMKKEAEKFKLPLDFLEGVSKGDLSQFEQRGRDNRGYYIWHIPSLDQDVKLHGLLLRSMEDAFQGKPLGPTLVYYGLADWREGKLAEQRLLMSSATTSALVSKEAPICKREEVEQALTGGKLGITARDAKKALDAVFNPSLSLEENVTHCLQHFAG
jgi:hypothetical protein